MTWLRCLAKMVGYAHAFMSPIPAWPVTRRSPSRLLRRYFKYTRMTLPLEYNALSDFVSWRPAPAGDQAVGTSSLRAPSSTAAAAAGASAKANSSTAWSLPQAAHVVGGRGGLQRLWGRRRRLAGLESTVRGSESAQMTSAQMVPHTLGGTKVIILHHAVEDKPWQRRACQAAQQDVGG